MVKVMDEKIYNGFAKYYDYIYSKKNYRAEAVELNKLIYTFKPNWVLTKNRNLLDLACGTGNHLFFLQHSFNCWGLDKNPGMLKIARTKLGKEIKLAEGDMIKHKPEFNNKFDVVICMFSSIAYVKNIANLEKVLKNIFLYLKEDGIAIIEPWFEKSDFTPGTFARAIEEPPVYISRIAQSTIKNGCSEITYYYSIMHESGSRIKYFVDHHSMALFTNQETTKAMDEAGFISEYVLTMFSDRGLFILNKSKQIKKEGVL